MSDDHGDIGTHDLSRKIGKTLVVTFCPPVFDDDIHILDVAEVAQTPPMI